MRSEAEFVEKPTPGEKPTFIRGSAGAAWPPFMLLIRERPAKAICRARSTFSVGTRHLFRPRVFKFSEGHGEAAREFDGVTPLIRLNPLSLEALSRTVSAKLTRRCPCSLTRFFGKGAGSCRVAPLAKRGIVFRPGCRKPHLRRGPLASPRLSGRAV